MSRRHIVTTENAAPSKARQVKRVEEPSPQMFSVYASDVQLQLSPWDMRLRFGDFSIIEEGTEKIAHIKVLGDVKMSLPLAKRLVALMASQLDAYEQNVGEIPLHKE